MAQNTKVGVLTIGQSPRPDVTPTIQAIIGSNVEIVEAGALDSLSEEELMKIRPLGSEATYISRLRNEQSIKISKTKLLPLLQDALNQLERQVSVVIMLCTGDFPNLISTKPIIYPDKLLKHLLIGMDEAATVGLIVPLESQKNSLLSKWGEMNVIAEAASPYEHSDIHGAAKALQANGASVIVLDCIGYQKKHKREAYNATGLPVILPQTLIARIAAEYVCV